MITGVQLRAARSALHWTTKQLAEFSGVSLSTLKRIEKFDGIPDTRSSTLANVQKTFEAAGIEFIGTAEDRPGIRISRNS